VRNQGSCCRLHCADGSRAFFMCWLYSFLRV